MCEVSAVGRKVLPLLLPGSPRCLRGDEMLPFEFCHDTGERGEATEGPQVTHSYKKCRRRHVRWGQGAQPSDGRGEAETSSTRRRTCPGGMRRRGGLFACLCGRGRRHQPQRPVRAEGQPMTTCCGSP
jgi:hypothetical protein